MRNEKGQFVKGNKHSPEIEKKRRVSLRLSYSTGKRKPVRYWLGKKMPKEVGKKISEIKMGVKLSEETRKKLSVRMKKYFENPANRLLQSKRLSGNIQSKETIEKRVSQMRGENNWNWKGGITPLVRKIRVMPEMKKWTRDCLIRDNFKCIGCGSVRDLEVDHIKPFSWIIYENKISSIQEALSCGVLWDLGNGRTLCRECHKKLQNAYHRIYGK